MKNKDLNEDELTAIVEEHPYYSIAQWWLLLNYKKNKNKNFERQASVTALFFENAKWLNWQLIHQQHVSLKNEAAMMPSVLMVAPEKPRQPEVVPVKANEEVMAFEPLYTVDYFASQGIKISEEALANDKLGTQLKSFTDWLKSMKKLHAAKLPAGDEQLDKKIQHIAESSNDNINVITEAMAEVLLKQGKVEQAIEIYNKLSLNYPAGSAYFTGKINSLKSV